MSVLAAGPLPDGRGSDDPQERVGEGARARAGRYRLRAEVVCEQRLGVGTGGMVDFRRYLDPKVLAKISGLELRARLLVEGYFSGMHRSPYCGASVEFADYRQYAQGDDYRHIDWKVYARTDKHYIKQYEEETNLTCLLVVDCSRSMRFQSADAVLSKHEYAVSIAAALAYLALRQQDSVGLALFDERITTYLRPSNHPAHWKTLLGELVSADGGEKTSVRTALDDVAERLNHRSMVVVISDLFDDGGEVLEGLRHLRYRNNETLVFNVWDPAELSFPFSGPTRFEGVESSETLLTEPRLLRERYLEEVESFIANLRRGCREMQIDYTLFNTGSALDVAIGAYLATRGASIRHRASRVLRGK
ncbi:MAG: DUF58 domain-containing protein [bacterium]|nr:DUF58 domain-containing protein [bacterium]